MLPQLSLGCERAAIRVSLSGRAFLVVVSPSGFFGVLHFIYLNCSISPDPLKSLGWRQTEDYPQPLLPPQHGLPDMGQGVAEQNGGSMGGFFSGQHGD